MEYYCPWSVWNIKKKIWNSCVNVCHLLSSAVYYMCSVHDARIRNFMALLWCIVYTVCMLCVCVRVSRCAHDMIKIKNRSEKISNSIAYNNKNEHNNKSSRKTNTATPQQQYLQNGKIYIYCTYFEEKYTLKTNCCNKYSVCDT